MTEQTQPSTIKVQAYSLAEALQQAQTGVQQGYTIDLESNEGYPQQFGSMITFTLLKANVGAIHEVTECITNSVIDVITAMSDEEVKSMIKGGLTDLNKEVTIATKYKRKEK